MKPEEAAFPAWKKKAKKRTGRNCEVEEYMVFSVNVLLSIFVRDHFITYYCLLVLILLLSICFVILLYTSKCFFALNTCPFLFLIWYFSLGAGYWGWISGMPTNPYMYASDLIEVLKKKHASGTYKSLVSCH